MQDRLRNLAKVDRTVAPQDLWERIRNGFAVPDLDSDLVREKTNHYVSRPEYLQRILNRSRLYLYHIVEEIEKRGLPTELALLPMVESAFNPMAYSRAHASGIWQFIPGTGKRYELEQNWWYDGRRDIVASTTAALEYLSALYEMHGDWQLALASYNWGENAVARAIAKNRAAGLPTDYANLTMPAETRHYIPKLQALKNIIANPAPFGIKLEPIPNEPYFATTDSKARDIDVRLAAKLAEMPVAEFIALNPGFSRPLIRAAVTPRIVLPADKIDVFHDNLSKLGERSLVSWKSYHPRKGETFESIAKKFGMTLGQLREVNGIGPRVKAVPNLMVVPVSGAEATLGKLPIMYAPPIPVVLRRIFHTVKQGETAAAIARRYRVSVEDLKRWNPLSRFTAGQKIAVEVRAPVRATRPQAKAKTKPAKKSSR
ncbi:MAG: transglycosylase SLT domain-containing protein [Pseudomonadota bacterium]|nr:transglycosylase SLT domain-containing protein [Pseudomonadota bacterium]